MNYYKRHIGDYAKKTRHLSLLQKGVYDTLLDIYYDTEKPIPENAVEMLVGAQTEEEKKALTFVLTNFFRLKNGKWINKRCEEEIAKAHRKSYANATNGKKGGRPKTQKKPTDNPVGFDNPVGLSWVSEKKPYHKPIAISQEPVTIPPMPPTGQPPLVQLDNGDVANPETGEVYHAEKSPPRQRPRPKFTPPTLADATAYGQRLLLPAEECEKFLDHYAAVGWVSGGGKPLRDWQAAMRNWHRNFRSGRFGSKPGETHAPDSNHNRGHARQAAREFPENLTL